MTQHVPRLAALAGVIAAAAASSAAFADPPPAAVFTKGPYLLYKIKPEHVHGNG